MRKFGLLLLGSLAFLSTACHPGFASKDPAKRAEWVLNKVAKKLDLDADQKAKAAPIFLALAQRRQEWSGEGGRVVEEIRLQAEADSFDQTALNKSFAAREAKLTESRLFVVQKLAELHALLKPAQRQKAAELLGKMEAHMQKWHRS